MLLQVPPVTGLRPFVEFVIACAVLRHHIPAGCARRFGAEIVNDADDSVTCGKALAAATRAAGERTMERLPLYATKARCVRVSEEPLESLGYRVERHYNPRTGKRSQCVP